MKFLAALLFLAVIPCFAQKVAITFDDLPLNGIFRRELRGYRSQFRVKMSTVFWVLCTS